MNSEIWDLRTYKLLHSVPSLDGCALNFSNDSKIIYAHLRRTSDDLVRIRLRVSGVALKKPLVES